MNLHIIFPILIAFFLYQVLRKDLFREEWQAAFLSVAIIIAGTTVVTTEVLGFFHILDESTVRSCWIIGFLFAAGLFLKKRAFSLDHFKGCYWMKKPSSMDVVLGVFLGWFVLMAGGIAFLSTPNNWDSMVYHLPRTMHWLAQHSLDYYPTNIPRQNSYPPGSEILVLNFLALSGSDRWSGLIQYIGLAGSLVGISSLAKELGLSRTAHLVSLVFAATIPVVLLESSTLQTDLVATCWFMASLVFFWRGMRKEGSLLEYFLAGGAVALAVLSKGVFIVFTVPFFLLSIRRVPLKRMIFSVGAMLLAMGLICGGFLYRTYAQDPGSRAVKVIFMERHDPAAIGVNIARNLASGLNAPSEEIAGALRAFVHQVHRFLNVPFDDPSVIWGDPWNIADPGLVFYEDFAGNPVHTVWICIFLMLLIFIPLSGSRKKYVLAWGFICLIFVLLFKPQPWITRFHIWLLLPGALVIGIVAERYWRLAFTFCIMATLYGVLVLSCNPARPLKGKTTIFSLPQEQMFVANRHFLFPYSMAAKAIIETGCADVGLLLGEDTWEYPLWSLSGAKDKGIHFYHLDAPMPRSIRQQKISEGECLIITDRRDMPDVFKRQGREYVRWGKKMPILDIFRRVP